MISSLTVTGADWLISRAQEFTEKVFRQSPVEFNEECRYLSEAVAAMPGYIRYDAVPYMREILECADVRSGIREVSLQKGVQIGYTTTLESVALYYMAHIGTLPMMFVTADKELAMARLDNNILPMLHQSGMADILRSSDEDNKRKSGKTKDHLQFRGGGYMLLFGAKSPTKLRQASMAVILKDEIDAWPDMVGRDGDPDKLVDARASGHWEHRMIFNGSTPLETHTSKIVPKFLRGDQRRYHVLCKSCQHPQVLRWETVDKETGMVGGFDWEIVDGVLDLESVCYRCQKCGEPHYEYDKERLFSEAHGAKWIPTAKPAEPGLRSYHIPAFYSPINMQPWYKCVSDYLEAFDPEDRRIKNIRKYQVFYNNILAEPFEIRGYKIQFAQVSAHRRTAYCYGQIPNAFAIENSGSHVLLVTCQVDVHKNNLAVSVMGWTRNMCCYLIDYWRFDVKEDDPDCSQIESPAWSRLRELIEEKSYDSDDGKRYIIEAVLIDAGYAQDTVTTFCASFDRGVFPILGRDRAGKNQQIIEFSEWETRAGQTGYRVTVDHYKDRMSSVLRRDWGVEDGEQKIYHFNAPVDATDKQLKELTVESRKEKIDDKGSVTYYWDRPKSRDNELWDLLGYGYAAVEIIAWNLCINHFELDTVEWDQFWDHITAEQLYYSEIP